MRHPLWCIAALAGLLASPASATPCTPYGRTLDTGQAAVLARAIAAQMQVQTVDILDAFQDGGWHMVYVDTHEADEAVLLFRGDPATHRSLTAWSGAARRDEQRSLRSWAAAHAPGIPHGLARCFGWYVTKGRTR